MPKMEAKASEEVVRGEMRVLEGRHHPKFVHRMFFSLFPIPSSYRARMLSSLCLLTVGRILQVAREGDKIIARVQARCRQQALIERFSQCGHLLERHAVGAFGTFHRFSPADRNAKLMRFVVQYAYDSSVSSGMTYLHDHGIVHRDPKYVTAPPVIHCQIIGEIFWSDAWLMNKLENIVFRPKDPSWDTLFTDVGSASPWIFSLEICLVCVSFDLAVPSTSIPLGNHPPPSQSLGYVAPEEPNQKGHGKPVDLWSTGYGYSLPLPIIHSAMKC